MPQLKRIAQLEGSAALRDFNPPMTASGHSGRIDMRPRPGSCPLRTYCYRVDAAPRADALCRFCCRSLPWERGGGAGVKDAPLCRFGAAADVINATRLIPNPNCKGSCRDRYQA